MRSTSEAVDWARTPAIPPRQSRAANPHERTANRYFRYDNETSHREGTGLDSDHSRNCGDIITDWRKLWRMKFRGYSRPKAAFTRYTSGNLCAAPPRFP